MAAPSLKDLDCLNAWPENTIGYYQDEECIKTLHALCEEHGYGRMQQLMEAIHDIWRDPEAGKAMWGDFRRRRMKFMLSRGAHPTTSKS